MEWINQNAEFLKALLTLASLIVTFSLLKLNYDANKTAIASVEQMRSAREEENRPYVFLDIGWEGREMTFNLKNFGRNGAYKVKFSLDQKIKVWNSIIGKEKETLLSDTAIAKPIEMLAPGEAFSEWIDTSYQFFQNNENHKFTGSISYQDIHGKAYQEPLALDFTAYAKQRTSYGKHMPELVAAVEKICKNLRGF